MHIRPVIMVLVLALCCAARAGVVPAGGDSIVCAPQSTGFNAGDLNFFHPESPPAYEIRELAWLIMGICAAIFVVVESVLIWSIIRFRRRSAETGEPQQVFGSNPIELAWTVIPTIVVFVLSLATIRTIREVQLTVPPKDALQVDVIAHQWWWEYRLKNPADSTQIVTANELVVPVGRTVWLTLRSADVIHSWWVPRLNGKTDLIPNHVNATWFEAQRAGVYLGQCAEYCGTQHANMLLRVTAVEPNEFLQWCARESAPVVNDQSVSQGRELFLNLACMNCHAIGSLCDGTFGPNLTHLMNRTTIGAGVAPLNPQSLRAWVDDPSNLKVGCNMPSLKLDESQLDSIVAYLLTLK